jgi:vacuolar-type H+-ATPase subunit I/STV1
MLEPPPAPSGYNPNSQNSEPSQPDLSSDNNLGNTPENQLEREEAEKREMENIARSYMEANYVGTNSPAESPRSHSSLESGSKDSSPDPSKPEEQKPTAPENTLFVMPDGEWYIDDKGRSYLSEFIKKTQEKKVDVKSPEELEEELKKLELSKKKKKLEELTGKINTAKTQTPRLFEELGNEIEKLKTQIEKEKETVSEALKKEAVISNIITQIEDPEIYAQFPKNKGDPIEGIITKILAEEIGRAHV